MNKESVEVKNSLHVCCCLRGSGFGLFALKIRFGLVRIQNALVCWRDLGEEDGKRKDRGECNVPL